jgi:enamine deaminase RidA (YjgF/YER057c/UK114 family)
MNTSVSTDPPPAPAGIAQPLARYSAWRRCGDWLLLSGVIAVDPAANRIVRGYDDIPPEAQALLGRSHEFSTDWREGPILAQSWYVLDRIRATVESAGARMDQVVRLVQYFRDLDHFPHYSRVRRHFFPGTPPASTVVEVSAMLPSPDILIEVEATVWLGMPDA